MWKKCSRIGRVMRLIVARVERGGLRFCDCVLRQLYEKKGDVWFSSQNDLLTCMIPVHRKRAIRSGLPQ